MKRKSKRRVIARVTEKIKRLKDAGISEIQAEAQTEALTQALEQFRIEARLADLASKRDLKEVEVRLEARIAETESRLAHYCIQVILALRKSATTSFSSGASRSKRA